MARISRYAGAGIGVAVLLAAGSAVRGQSTWTNGAADGLWSAAGNWSADVPDSAGESALFAGAGAGNVDIENAGAGFSFNTVTFSAGGYRLIDGTGDNDTLNAAGGVFFNSGTNEVVGPRLGNSNVTLGGVGAVLKLIPTNQEVVGLWTGRYAVNGGQTDITFSNSGGAYTPRSDSPFAGTGALSRTPNLVVPFTAPLTFGTDALPGGGGDEFLVAWTGTFTPATSVAHIFRITNAANSGSTDDHGSIYVDVNNDGIFQAAEGIATTDQANTASFDLTAGQRYHVAIGFNEDGGGESFSVRLQTGGAGSFNVLDTSAGQFHRMASSGAVSTGDLIVTESGTVDVEQTAGTVTWTYDSLNVTAGKTFTKTGAGRLKFTGPSTGSGAISINTGSIEVTADGGLGSTATPVAVASGAKLVISTNYAEAKPITLNGELAAESAASFGGPVTLGALGKIASHGAGQTFTVTQPVTTAGFELQVGGIGTVALAGGVNGSGTLRKVDSGTASLTAVTAHTGPTVAADGILSIDIAGALPATSGISVPNGGTLQVAVADALSAGNVVTLTSGGRLRATNAMGVSTNVTIPSGGILDIAVGNGLTHSATITRETGAVVRVSNTTGLNGSQLLASQIGAGAIVQLNTNNITNLNDIGAGVVLEIFGGNRTQTTNAAFDITEKVLTDDGVNRIVSNSTNTITIGAAGGTIAATTSRTLEFDEQISAAGNPVTFGSTTALNGFAKAGTVRFDSSVNIGVATIAAGTVRLNQGSSLNADAVLNASGGNVDIYEGDTGTTNDILGTINLSNGRVVSLRVDEAATGGAPMLNRLNAPINVIDANGNNILRGDRDSDSVVNGFSYFSDVRLADGAQVRVEQANDQNIVVSAVVPVGAARIHHIDDANRDYLGNLSGPGSLSLTGTSEINLVGVLSTRLNVGGALGTGHLDLVAANATLTPIFGGGWTAPDGTLAVGAGGNLDVEDSGTLGALIFNGGSISFLAADNIAASGATLSITRQLGGSGSLPLAGIALGPAVQLTPGDNSTGILSLTGDLAVADSMSYAYEIGNTPATSDGIAISGQLTLGNVLNLTVTNVGNDPVLSDESYVLFSYAGADPMLPPTINFTGPLTGMVTVDAANNQVLLSNVVPEPSTAAVLAVTALGLLSRRRRR